MPLFLALCLVPRSGGFLVIGSSVNHQGKGCAKKGQCDLGPYFLQRGRGCCSESWLPDHCWHSGGLGTFTDRERRGWSHQGPGNLAVPVSYRARIANSHASDCQKGAKRFLPPYISVLVSGCSHYGSSSQLTRKVE